ncbi:MAG: hypothetical protein WAW46_13435, partial [Polaromonas sp.]
VTPEGGVETAGMEAPGGGTGTAVCALAAGARMSASEEKKASARPERVSPARPDVRAQWVLGWVTAPSLL